MIPTWVERVCGSVHLDSSGIAWGRTLIALAQLSVLCFTSTSALFAPVGGADFGPRCTAVSALSAYCLVPSNRTAYLDAVSVIFICVLLAIAANYRPRVFSWIHVYVSYSISTAITLPDGGDSVAIIATVFIALASLGDRRVWGWTREYTGRAPWATSVGIGAIIALRVQLCFLYLDAAVAKFGVDDWANGTALYYIERSAMFGDAGLLAWLDHGLTSWSVSTAFFTWGALVIEIILAVGLLGGTDLRRLALQLDVILHVGIIVAIGLWSFGLIMIGSVLVAVTLPRPRLPMHRGEVTTCIYPHVINWQYFTMITRPYVESGGVRTLVDWGPSAAAVVPDAELEIGATPKFWSTLHQGAGTVSDPGLIDGIRARFGFKNSDHFRIETVRLVPVEGAPEFFYDASCPSCVNALVRSNIRPGAVSFVPLGTGKEEVRFEGASGAVAMACLWHYSSSWYMRCAGWVVRTIPPIRWAARREYARHAQARVCGS